jgi:hypothetical protein
VAFSAGVDVDEESHFWKNLPERHDRRRGSIQVLTEAALVCNLLLSVCAILIGGLPEGSSSNRDVGLYAEPPYGEARNPASNREFRLATSIEPIAMQSRRKVDRPNRDVDLDAVFHDEDTAVGSSVVKPLWQPPIQPKRPVVRGQSPDGSFTSPPMTAPLMSPYDPKDPFQIQAGPDPVLPYVNDPGQMLLSGINGPQPYRFGFTPIFDGVLISPAHAKSPGQGNFGVQEYDGALKYVSMLGPDWIFTNTAQAGGRVWNGPNTPNLPGSVYRLGWDFLLNSPQVGGWSAQLDFNPSINSDFANSLGRESLNLDAYAALFYRTNPQWMWVLGVQYWDRVNNILIPYAGAVWNPNERTELRMLFPKSRISYFLGTHGTGSHWLYATGEFHVESYQISMPGVSGREQIQLSDWRLGVGLRSDHQWYDKYIELGYVFSRQNIFLGTTPGFNLTDGIMARFGVRF